MEQASVIHNTFTLERHYPAAPHRVFKAFSDPAQKRRWIGAGEHNETELFELDFRVGGNERVYTRFGPQSPFPGAILAREASHFNIVPDRRVVIASSMTLAGKCISVSLETFELLPEGEGTNLVLTHQAAFFEGADGPEMRKDGWEKLLTRIETLF